MYSAFSSASKSFRCTCGRVGSYPTAPRCRPRRPSRTFRHCDRPRHNPSSDDKFRPPVRVKRSDFAQLRATELAGSVSDRDFRGVVHLHGRVDERYRTAQDDEFVVSSANFGRAYLSLCWATRFIQALLSRFQILFVGYTADDPSVQYLLEGLNLRAGTRNRRYAHQYSMYLIVSCDDLS